MSVKVGLAADHGGFSIKELIKQALEDYQLIDYGTHSSDSCDYPIYAHKLAQAVNEGTVDYGIIVCSTGNGVNMVANKYPRVRCALCWDVNLVKLAREHNNANMLALPGRYLHELANLGLMVKTFLTTPFEAVDETTGQPSRHARRVKQIPIP